MRRYELMLVLRPDTADDRVQQILDRTTRGIGEGDGQIVKVSPGAAAGWPIRSRGTARAPTSSSSSRRPANPSMSSSAA